jgi:FHS family L-fucose permease-like MFS transporter
VGALFLLAAALFFFSKKVPSGISTERTEKANKALYTLLIMTGLLIIMFVPVFNSYKTDVNLLSDTEKHDLETYRLKWLFGALAVVIIPLLVANFSARKNPEGWGAMRYPQLILGMIGILVYVGAEVTIVSNLGELLRQPDFGGFQSSEVAPYVSLYWGSLMIGRWAGAISAFNLRSSTRQVLLFIVPLIAFGIVILINYLSKYDVTPLYYYVVCVLVQIAAFYISKDRPARTLLLFSMLGLIAMLIGLFTEGRVATYAFLSGGLFCSIMWPAIFNLSILGLGKYTTQGSAFLIMMILGGGIIPPIQGKLADYLQSKSDVAGYGIHQSYWVAVACFAYLAFLGFAVKGILRRQGVNYEDPIDETDALAHQPEAARDRK